MVAIVATSLVAAPLIAAGPAMASTPAVALGAASGYSVLGHETVTNTGNTVIGGDLGVSPGTSVTGFGPGVIRANNGAFHSADDSAAAAQSAVTTAYNDAAGRSASSTTSGDLQLGGRTFYPGVYGAASSAQITGTVTLDGAGDPGAVFIFQMGSTLTTAAGSPSVPASTVKLVHGAQAANVFWLVGSSATLGTYSYFSGTILALASVTVTTGAHVNGRAFARTGAVTLDDDDFATPPTEATAPHIAITSPDVATSSTPTISGTSDAASGSAVAVAVGTTAGGTSTVIAQVVDGGTWSVVSPTLATGANSVTATVTDAADNTASAFQTLTLATGRLQIAITSPALTNRHTPTISGTTNAVDGSAVSVTVAGDTLSGVVSGGLWSVVSPVLADGQHNVVATVTDHAGNTGSDSQTLTVDSTMPTIAITSPSLTNNPTPTLSGTSSAPVGSVVAVTVDFTKLPPTTVVTGGTWAVTSSTLADGTHAVGATVTNPAGSSANDSQELTVDLTKPLIAITSPAVTNNRTPTISGTSDSPDGAIVTVTVDGVALAPSPTVKDHKWSVPTSTLPDGSHAVVASVTDPAGNTGTDRQTLTINTVTPLIAITSPAITNQRTPTISGTSTAAVDSVVSVFVDDQGLITRVVAGGTWSIVSPTLAEGGNDITAIVTDAAGKTGTAHQTLVLDTVKPTIEITSPNLTTSRTPTITGKSDAPNGSVVTVTVDGVKLAPSPVVTSSSWSVPSPALVEGQHRVVASVTDPAGNVGTADQVLTVDTIKPLIAITSALLTNKPISTISGTTDALDGSAVSVSIASELLPAVASGGVWSVLSPSLGQGDFPITASTTDPAGNIGSDTKTLVVDMTKPLVAITSPALTKSKTPTISGTSDAPDGSAVTVTVDGVKLSPSPVVTDGTWSAPSPTLSDGTHQVVATVSDPAGNVGTASQSLVVDTTAPAIAITSPALTKSKCPIISGTSDAADGSVVVVTIDGKTVVPSPTVSHGTWAVACTALTDGPHTIIAVITDPAGNSTLAEQTLVVDTIAPLIEITSPPITNSRTPTIKGTSDAPDRSVVTVTVDGVRLSPSPTVTNGIWSVPSPTLTDGQHPIVATTTDLAGNIGTAHQTLTVNTTSPLIVITSPALTNKTAPMISGTSTAPVSSVVTVTVNGVTLPATRILAAGAWTIQSPTLVEGSNTVTALVTDAGRTGTTHQNLTLDTVKPLISITSPDGTTVAIPTIFGTTDAPAGSVVTVTVDGVALAPSPLVVGMTVPIAVAVASLSRRAVAAVAIASPIGGTWTVVSSKLANGSHAVVATVSDPAGNTSSAVQTLKVDTSLSTLPFDPPVIAITSPNTSRLLQPIISGTTFSIAGSIVYVTIDGVNLPTTAATADGKWSVLSRTLTEGPHAVMATIIDAHGSASANQTLTINTQLPTYPFNPAAVALAATGGDISGGIWGALLVILGALVLLGRSIHARRKNG